MILLIGSDVGVSDTLADVGVGEVVVAATLSAARAVLVTHRPRLVALSSMAALVAVGHAAGDTPIFYLCDVSNPVEKIAAFALGAVAYIVRSETDVLDAAARAATTSDACEEEPAVVGSGRRLH